VEALFGFARKRKFAVLTERIMKMSWSPEHPEYIMNENLY
jgi:hypothetical protein